MQMTYNSIINNNYNYNNNEVLTLLIVLNILSSSFSAMVIALNKTSCHLSVSHFSESVHSKMKGMPCCSCALVSLLSWVTTLPVYVFQLAPHQCRVVLMHAVCLLSLALWQLWLHDSGVTVRLIMQSLSTAVLRDTSHKVERRDMTVNSEMSFSALCFQTHVCDTTGKALPHWVPFVSFVFQ